MPKPPPRILRRRSTLHGYGVYAGEPITKNTRIVDYAGELVRTRDCAGREARYLAEGCIWTFRVNRLWIRDAAVGRNIARFINHSCRPNCWFDVVDRTIWIRAGRNIQAGEELTYRLQDGRRAHDQVPLPAGLPALAVVARRASGPHRRPARRLCPAPR